MRSEKRRFPRGPAWRPCHTSMSLPGSDHRRTTTKVGEDWFCIAGLWRPVEGDAAAFTMLTCEPGPDVAPIHNRQIVVLDRSEWAAWLNSQTAEEDLLKPSPPGSLKVEKVEGAPGKQFRSRVPAACLVGRRSSPPQAFCSGMPPARSRS